MRLLPGLKFGIFAAAVGLVVAGTSKPAFATTMEANTVTPDSTGYASNPNFGNAYPPEETADSGNAYGGGVCATGSGCSTANYSGTGWTVSNGMVDIPTNGCSTSLCTMTVSITPGTAGSVFVAAVGSTVLGTTPVVKYNVKGAATTFPAVVVPSGTVDLAITDLVLWFAGEEDDLPGDMGVSSDIVTNKGLTALNSTFGLTVSFSSAAPEPATITLMAGGLLGLGLLRRRKASSPM